MHLYIFIFIDESMHRWITTRLQEVQEKTQVSHSDRAPQNLEVFLFAVRQEILRVDEFEVPFGAYPQNEQRGDWEVYIRTETYSSAFHSGIERGLG